MADDLTGIRLRPRAQADLEDIWRFGAETWSPEQADRYLDGLLAAFGLLREMPLIARERDEFSPPVRIHPTGPHLVIYRIADRHLDVLRVLGGRQDWHRLLDALD
ncbi:type II toxin-antitoxin system RelE/ParE family toxin [Salipiger marinus]|uniref:type II toxin-antitoxin system RelE/ParE family toxin n=1 Tax=Salipiger marinus TaxID=555512 RepID=UPI002CF796F8|nr:type II toxin-antitoxin system RelE/ParE family toxin [Salipiger manganoxidans]MEB3419070.1 type II toxin-antitoxin system RelE/ParE family toxin [Salipiger manganoxidans]